ncbi:MAG: formylglycine-generating enzyme family protein, partial [Planctomycetaceae bacterium]
AKPDRKARWISITGDTYPAGFWVGVCPGACLLAVLSRRIFWLRLSVALTIGCAGTVVAQQSEAQPGSPAKQQPPEAATGGQPKEVVNTIGMKLLLIPAGTFTMGSPASEIGRSDDENQHQVTLTKSFYMGRTEVTQGQWRKVSRTEPWKAERYVLEGDDNPAVYVSWNDAVEFCEKLSALEGKPYRLPTEAEWEYACRGRTKTAFSFGEDEADLGKYAWYDGNAWKVKEKYSHRVAQKLANPFGLHDLHGNNYEWCRDWYGDYPSAPLTDPRGPDAGSSRVLRGGSWYSEPSFHRSANRSSRTPEFRCHFYGFRLVL